jgi:hypothetical protein
VVAEAGGVESRISPDYGSSHTLAAVLIRQFVGRSTRETIHDR